MGTVMTRIGRHRKYPEGPKRQVFVLLTPADQRVHLTITERAPNTITAVLRGQDLVYRHTAPAPTQHRATIPTLYALSRRPGTAARFVSETVMLLFDIDLDGFGYLVDFAVPKRSHWGDVGRDCC